MGHDHQGTPPRTDPHYGDVQCMNCREWFPSVTRGQCADCLRRNSIRTCHACDGRTFVDADLFPYYDACTACDGKGWILKR